MNNRVRAVIDGKVYEGWKSVKIDISIDQIARAFALSVTDDFPGNATFMRLSPGSSVQLFIGDDLVCTGYITSVPVSYGATSVTVTVQGKSRTVDLVDCCPDVSYGTEPAKSSWADVKPIAGDSTKVKAPASKNATWSNVKTGEIIAALTASYGIDVYAQENIGSKLANFTVTPGETLFEAINRILVKDNLTVTDDEAGNLVIGDISRVATASDALVLGENILTGSRKYDFSERFSDYLVLGQHSGTDDDFGRSASEDRGTAKDDDIKRFRLKVLKNEGQGSSASCGKRALSESAYRVGKSLSSTYSVQGWRQKSGSLWKCCEEVNVIDSVLGVEGKMLITKVSYELSSSGMKTTMELCLREAYRKATDKGKNDAQKSSGESWNDVQ